MITEFDKLQIETLLALARSDNSYTQSRTQTAVKQQSNHVQKIDVFGVRIDENLS